jgi:hypothetical protein
MRVSSVGQWRLALAALLVMAACGGANHSSADASGAAGGHEGVAASSGVSAATGGSAGTAGSSSSAGGASGAGAGGSAGAVAINCSATGTRYFPDFPRSCQTASDCVLATHTHDCCGDIAVTAIAASAKADFDAAELVCLSQYPFCNCLDTQWLDVEDGTRTARSRQNQVIASCDAGSCKAHYTGATFACGTYACTELEYCRITSSGDAGTPPTSLCMQTTCTSCDCLSYSITQGCHCSFSGGAFVLTCQ